MQLNRLHHDLFKQLMIELEMARIKPEKLLAKLRSQGVTPTNFSQSVFLGTEALVLLEVAAELTGDPSIAIRLGQRIGIESYGTFGFALMSCANQRESIALLERYGKVFFDPSWQSYEHNGGLWLRMNLPAGTVAQQQLITELCFSLLTSIGSSLQRGIGSDVEIQVTYPEPAYSASYDSALPATVHFNCEYNQVFLPAELLDTPIRTANPSEHVVFHQQCEEILQSLESVEKTTTAVRRLLMQSAGQFLNITQVADRLHVSERTLRRRLSSESTSFKIVLEEIKNLLAREYLAKTLLTVAEIAYLLNYEETGNFRRAFVRWNGETPIHYRQMNGQITRTKSSIKVP
jgi:AraC-like DNA-binding protein